MTIVTSKYLKPTFGDILVVNKREQIFISYLCIGNWTCLMSHKEGERLYMFSDRLSVCWIGVVVYLEKGYKTFAFELYPVMKSCWYFGNISIETENEFQISTSNTNTIQTRFSQNLKYIFEVLLMAFRIWSLCLHLQSNHQ